MEAERATADEDPRALQRLSEGAIRLFDVLLQVPAAASVLDALAQIAGETLGTDRTLIYDVSLTDEKARCVTQWLNPAHPDVLSASATYPLSQFRATYHALVETRDVIESHADAPHRSLVADGIADRVHRDMGTKSLVWYPFMFHDDGFRLLAFAHVVEPHAWTSAELDFMRTATRHVSMALVRSALEDKLRRREVMLSDAQQLAHIGSFEMDPERSVCRWTVELYRIFGRDPARFVPSCSEVFELMHPDDQERVRATVEDARANRKSFTFEARLVTPSGQIKFIHCHGEVDNDAQKIRGYVQDITDRKQAEEQIRASLREKEVLLAEVHHRVNNDLQVINSLLRLQLGSVSDDGARKILVEVENRIHSFALAHQLLYQTKDFARIDMHAYLTSLVHHLAGKYEPERSGVELAVCDLSLDLETALSVGLVVNELVTNAFVHAFVDRPWGHISLRVARHEDQVILQIADDGRGMHEHLSAEHVGLRIVFNVVKQLGGTLAIEGDHGTSITISFPYRAERQLTNAV